ncbi:MAG: hypothetical protein ABEI58_02920 [Candidatus Nanohaloarchaea archaeon]
MLYENPEKNAIYTQFSGDIAELAEKITGFCEGRYGDRCEFYDVSIERTRDGNHWRVHEFKSFDDRAVRAVRNHLEVDRDVIRVRFGGKDRDYELEFIICSPQKNAGVARFVDREDLSGFDEGSLIVLAVEKKSDEIAQVQRDFLEDLG